MAGAVAGDQEKLVPVGWTKVSMRLSPQKRWCWIADALKPQLSIHPTIIGSSLAMVSQAVARLRVPVHHHHTGGGHVARPTELLAVSETAFIVHVRALSGFALPMPSGSMDTSVDAYVTFSYMDEPAQRSLVVRGTNPHWMEREEDQHRFSVQRGMAERQSRIRGEVWDRAMVPPDTLLATFDIPVAETQLEVVVRDIELTPASGTEPQTDKPTVRMYLYNWHALPQLHAADADV